MVQTSRPAIAAQLEKLAKLHAEGGISDEEFERLKAALLEQETEQKEKPVHGLYGGLVRTRDIGIDERNRAPINKWALRAVVILIALTIAGYLIWTA